MTTRSDTDLRASLLVAYSTDAMLTFDRHLCVTAWNPRLERLSGITERDALGRSPVDLIPALRNTDYERILREALEGVSSIEDTWMLALSPGRPQVCETTVAPIRDASGAVTGGLAVIHDVTQHVTAEATVRETERRFQIMADCAPVLLWMADTDGRCTFFNQFWLEFTGRSQAQEFGWGWAEGVHPEDFQRCVDVYMAAFCRRESFSMEYRLRRHDGEYRWVLDNGVCRFLPDGTFAGFIGSCVDITERKIAEKEREANLLREQGQRKKIQVLYQDAQEANRLKDEFLATISHELRTPLNAIAGWAGLLKEGLVEATNFGEAFDSIDRNARAQSKIIDDLLDVSRIITGKIKLDEDPVELKTVTQAAAESVRLSAASKKIELCFRFDDSVGPVLGDALRLQQVVWNLLSNAVKFTPAGGKVVTTLGRHGSRVRLTVSDSGQGIDPGFLPHVFERFRQADGTLARRHGGLGLGLAIAKYLVELHGGAISVESPGENLGATFTVDLPLMAVRLDLAMHADEGIKTPRPAKALDARIKVLDGLDVLLVDDQPDVLSVASVILRTYGANVVGAESGPSALEILKDRDFDCILSDIGMPGMDGYSFFEQLRSDDYDCRSVPVAAFTAHANEADRRRALDLGFAAHLAKPVKPESLVRTVAALTGRAEPLAGVPGE